MRKVLLAVLLVLLFSVNVWAQEPMVNIGGGTLIPISKLEWTSISETSDAYIAIQSYKEDNLILSAWFKMIKQKQETYVLFTTSLRVNEDAICAIQAWEPGREIDIFKEPMCFLVQDRTTGERVMVSLFVIFITKHPDILDKAKEYERKKLEKESNKKTL
jgi:hypothetical protein